MEYTQSEIIKQQALAASTTYNFDLGIQGISYLWIDITALQNAVNTTVGPDDFLNMLPTITVSLGGASILSGRAKDLARLGAIIAQIPLSLSQAANAANGEMHLSFFLPFGRKLFDPAEGMPAQKRGMLQIAITSAATFTPLVTPKVTIHQVEVPGNAFRRYNKYTQRTATPAATGLFDLPLPIGNLLRGILIASSTGYRDTNSMGSFNQTILMVNNVEHYWTGGVSGHSNHLVIARMDPQPAAHVHAHMENTAAAYTQNASTDPNQVNTTPTEFRYFYMDLDPIRDDTYSLDTSQGINLLSTRLDMAIAEQVWALAYESVIVR